MTSPPCRRVHGGLGDNLLSSVLRRGSLRPTGSLSYHAALSSVLCRSRKTPANEADFRLVGDAPLKIPSRPIRQGVPESPIYHPARRFLRYGVSESLKLQPLWRAP